jgi:hypothetical protein
MKHSLALLLGLTSLVLSSVPAYANNSSPNFDPSRLTLDRPHQLAQKSSEDSTRLKQQNSSIDRPADARKQIDPTKKNSDSDEPLFIEPSAIEPTYPIEQSHHPDRPHQPDIPNTSPFQFSDDITDAELFESEPEPNQVELDRERSKSTVDPELEFESTDAEFDQFFNRLQSHQSRSTSEASSDYQANRPDQTTADIERQTANHSEDKNRNRSNVAAIDLPQRSHASDKSLGLNFDLAPSHQTFPSAEIVTAAPISPPPVSSQTDATSKNSAQDELENLFVGESDSIVAIAVGSAEGTRSPDGGKNPAYQGHTDPGNGVWNLGSFSYQHGASSPEEADAKQLARLRTQAKTIFDKAASKGLNLTLEEKLNGIDLANQAPKAALDEFGYIDRLAEAYARGLSGSDAILWARVQSFIDPHTQTWDAPGLGNSEDRITRDQERRMIAIAKAIANYLQEIANGPSQKTSEDQAAQKSRTQPTGIAQLFTQPFTDLFASESSETKTDMQAELPIVQQILSLDLSS